MLYFKYLKPCYKTITSVNMTLPEYLDQYGRGAIKDLSKSISASPSQIGNWLRGRSPIPVARAIQIYFVTGGFVGLHEMRPDFFPPDCKLVYTKQLPDFSKEHK